MNREIKIGEVFYFGNWSSGIASGHHLHDTSGRCWTSPQTFMPWSLADLDNLLSRDSEQCEGKAIIKYKNGWSAVAFWDRSGDSRHGSSSVFISKGAWKFEQILEDARKFYPQIFKRFAFKIEMVERRSSTGVVTQKSKSL